ncbi:bifunctional diguanylate cyclase/phosphohydrolase [Romboutsia sp. 1001713B170131_170501_G6]|uniref:bifunctional diguanylate cyclase/phosphohydrolase n=1 Tax=Romboutsia sp. 1001713B170131_170501_G6 TaxID=2787108 RepID=UPI0018AAC6CE|nr:diguanylate cyclase [Romboutsia sp. 1001713B170131_170501_G6]
MQNFDKKRNKKVFEIIVILKVIYVISCLLAIASFVTFEEQAKDAITITISISIILTILMGYFLWISIYSKNRIDKSPKFLDYLETSILIGMFILVVFYTGKGESGYKLLSIFIVIISSIQFGKNYGASASIIQIVAILVISIMFTSEDKEMLRLYFERDLVLSAALFVIAIILGMYVDTEREHSKELRELANKDELTGLYNHRYFQEYLNNTLIEADKNNKEVSLLFMDIDYFKNYNDVNGHQAGDLLLEKIGKILNASMRENDIVARYGGEEFAAVLPDTTEEDAIKIGEDIRNAIQQTKFEGQENQPNKNITISIGVSSYPNRAINKHQLINTADDALYRAKSFNKNRVESYHSILYDLCREINIPEETIKSLKTFINMINIKDRYTYGHTERVVIYCKWFAQSMGLSEHDQVQIQIAAYLHDIGKLEIPEEVLNKKGRLTDEEFNMLRNHPQAGVDLIHHIAPLKDFRSIIRHHHERYDGKGYPDKLQKDEIPYLARMITIADSFDAMTSNRPYNTRKSHEEGIQELRANAGTQFDPYLVEKFIEMLEKYKDNF